MYTNIFDKIKNYYKVGISNIELNQSRDKMKNCDNRTQSVKIIELKFE